MVVLFVDGVPPCCPSAAVVGLPLLQAAAGSASSSAAFNTAAKSGRSSCSWGVSSICSRSRTNRPLGLGPTLPASPSARICNIAYQHHTDRHGRRCLPRMQREGSGTWLGCCDQHRVQTSAPPQLRCLLWRLLACKVKVVARSNDLVTSANVQVLTPAPAVHHKAR